MAEKNTLEFIAEQTLLALGRRYPNIGTQLDYHNPWELLVATQLAAQCTDARVNEVTPGFFSRWPTPNDLAKAKLEEIEEVIHSTGFFRNKAKNLLACARLLVAEHDGQVPSDMDALVKLPGVARKTANVVLYGGFGINAGIAVDTHVKRISYRLGLTDNIDPIKIEKDLLAIFPQSEWGNINLRIVQFGRDVCQARKPACASCELAAICPRRKPAVQPEGSI